MEKVENKDISPLQVFFEKAKKMQLAGENIINLGVGSPAVDLPRAVKHAVIRAVRNNDNYYIPAIGSIDMREKIVEWYAKKGLRINVNEVIASGGSRIALGLAIRVLLEQAGKNIMIPAPYYPAFVSIARSYGGQVFLLDTEKDGFILRADRIEEQIALQKVQDNLINILIINSPNNPTGQVIPKEERKKIVQVAKKYDLWIISDECYRNFSSEPDFVFRKLYPKSIIVDSVSKTFAMAGYRVGWALVPDQNLAQAIIKELNTHVSCFSSISERGAFVALDGDGIDDFHKQRNIVYAWLDKIGVKYQKTNAGFYVFGDFQEIVTKQDFKTAYELADHILDEAKVAFTPGIAFGNYPNYLRISYCLDSQKLISALNRVSKFLGFEESLTEINTASIETYRHLINLTDSELQRLLIKRFSLAKNIGELKKSLGIDIYDPAREQKIIQNQIEQGGLNKEFIEALFNLILNESKKKQKN